MGQNMSEGPLARFTRIKRPVARDEDLLVEHLGDETVVYDNRTKEAHCLSPLAAVVFGQCDGRTTVEGLAELATERLGEPVDEAGVIDALAQLQERDLLAIPPRDGLSRRQMIGKSAAAGGALWALPDHEHRRSRGHRCRDDELRRVPLLSVLHLK